MQTEPKAVTGVNFNSENEKYWVGSWAAARMSVNRWAFSYSRAARAGVKNYGTHTVYIFPLVNEIFMLEMPNVVTLVPLRASYFIQNFFQILILGLKEFGCVIS